MKKTIKKIIIGAVAVSVIASVFSPMTLGGFLKTHAEEKPIIEEVTDNGVIYQKQTSVYLNSEGNTVTRVKKIMKDENGVVKGGTIEESYSGIKDGNPVEYNRAKTFDSSNKESEWMNDGPAGNFDASPNAATEGNKAAENMPKDELSKGVSASCAWYKVWSIDCTLFRLAAVMTHVVFRVTNYITYTAGSIFNASITFSLNGESFKSEMINTGWKIVRDFINIIFIFILLLIAISTIIQYGDYRGKEALVGVIIAAVLVNFSLLMTKVIIDSSHVLAWEFYKRIDVSNEEKRGDGVAQPRIPEDMEIKTENSGTIEIKNLAGVFLHGFDPQKLILPSDASSGNIENVTMTARKEGMGVEATFFQTFLVYGLASMLNLFAAFLLFAAAIMFVIRIVILWLVLIFSPIAFMGMVSKDLNKYSSMWWEHLIGQSFFAPAFLFLFSVATIFINSDFLKNTIVAANESASLKILFIPVGSSVIIIFNFVIVAALMSACLIVAKQMGGKSAELGIGWAHKTRGWMQGQLTTWGGRGLRRAAGGAAEKVAVGEGRWFGKPLNKFLKSKWAPGGGYALGGLADVAVKNRERIKELQKGYEKYSTKELQSILPNAWSFNRAAIIQELTKRKGLEAKDVPEAIIEKGAGVLKYYGEKVGDIEKLRPEIIEPKESHYNKVTSSMMEGFRGDKENAAEYQEMQKKFSNDQIKIDQEIRKVLAKNIAIEEVLKKASAEDVSKFGDKMFEGKMLKLMIKNFNDVKARKIFDMGGDKAENFFREIVKLGNSFAEIADELEKQGNPSLAGWVRGSGVTVINSYGNRRGRLNDKEWVSKTAEDVAEEKKAGKRGTP